jgi:hypothetical protein
VIRLLLRLLGVDIDEGDRPAVGDVDSLLLSTTWAEGR